jgi:hypothetical protein
MTMAEKNASTHVDGKPATTTALARRDERRRHRRIPFEMFAERQDAMMRPWGPAALLRPRPPPAAGPGRRRRGSPVARSTRRAMPWSSR